MSEGFSIKLKSVRNLGNDLLIQSQEARELCERVEDISVSYGEVSSCAHELSRTLRSISERLGDQGNGLRSLSEKLEDIIARYEGTEQAILDNAVYSDDAYGKDGASEGGRLPDEVGGLDELISILEQLGGDLGWVVTLLEWLDELEGVMDNKALGVLGTGITICDTLIAIANHTLDNLKEGASANAIAADIISEVGMTIGGWAIETGCETIGAALGSAIPVVGTAIGTVAGSAIGAIAAEALDIAMNTDFDGDGDTGFDSMSGVIEDALDALFPGGKNSIIPGAA